ncbi:MAG: sugar ABC transporter permease [Clostridia bacterium]|nr:sugar ABC transporter permease [Clostridia bacterium]
MTQEVKLQNSASKPKKKRIASLDKRKARAGWFFVLPFVLGFVCIYVPMVWNSLTMSFQEITIIQGGGYSTEWVGWANYYDAFFKDTEFVQTLLTGLANMAFEIPAILVFSLFMAVLLNQKMMGRAAFRAIFFVPVIISTGIMETVQANDLVNKYLEETQNTGIDDGSGQQVTEGIVSLFEVERLFEMMQFGRGLAVYVVTMVNNIFNLVNRSGVQMLIFLSALQGISPAIYEACKIDGATTWETFWKITFPMISPMILVNAIYTVIDSFTTNSNIVMMYINDAYSKSGEEISSAMAWTYFFIIFLVVGIIAGICSAFVFYQRRD